jgi:hypothetical protein
MRKRCFGVGPIVVVIMESDDPEFLQVTLRNPCEITGCGEVITSYAGMWRKVNELTKLIREEVPGLPIEGILATAMSASASPWSGSACRPSEYN